MGKGFWPEQYIAVLDLADTTVDKQLLNELSAILRKLRIPIWQIRFRENSTNETEIADFAREFNNTMVYVDDHQFLRGNEKHVDRQTE